MCFPFWFSSQIFGFITFINFHQTRALIKFMQRSLQVQNMKLDLLIFVGNILQSNHILILHDFVSACLRALFHLFLSCVTSKTETA